MIKQSVLETLEQGIELLDRLSQQEYATPVPIVYEASIGGHYRHILEHFSTLLESYGNGFVNYDLRSRDKSIEGCIATARAATLNVMEKWKGIGNEVNSQSLMIYGKLSIKSDESMEVNSTFGREAAYSIAHAHHHYAIIGVMCNLLEKATSDNFGVAPSTVAYHKQQSEQEITA